MTRTGEMFQKAPLMVYGNLNPLTQKIKITEVRNLKKWLRPFFVRTAFAAASPGVIRGRYMWHKLQ